MGHIPTKLHQLLISSFRDFVQTDTQMQRQTDAAQNNTCSQHSWHTGNYSETTATVHKDVSDIRLYLVLARYQPRFTTQIVVPVPDSQVSG